MDGQNRIITHDYISLLRLYSLYMAVDDVVLAYKPLVFPLMNLKTSCHLGFHEARNPAAQHNLVSYGVSFCVRLKEQYRGDRQEHVIKNLKKNQLKNQSEGNTHPYKET